MKKIFISLIALAIILTGLISVSDDVTAAVVYSNRSIWTTEGGPCLNASGPNLAGHAFQTDNAIYQLNSVTIQIHSVSAPSTVFLGLYDDNGGQWGTQLVSLGSYTTTTNQTFPIATFTPAAPINLQPLTTYWAVASTTDPDFCDVAWVDYEAGVAPSGLFTYVADARSSGTNFQVVTNDFLPIEVDASPIVPGVSIAETAITTSESGTTATFDVVLLSQPIADVTVAITGLDTSEGSLSATSLTFTTGNWYTSQTVTVTGVDDVVIDGDISYSLTATTSSAGDVSYNSGYTDSVNVTNLDNDVPAGTGGLIVTPTTLLVAEDAPGKNFISISLGEAPISGETVTVDLIYNAAQLSLSISSVQFTSANWNVPVLVGVDAVADGIDEGIVDELITAATTSNLGATPLDGLSQVVTVSTFDSADTIILHVPNHGLIMIETWQAQPTFQSPHEGVIRMRNGNEMWFPHDADGNGYDTYVVTDIYTYNGDIWLALWMGSNRRAWVMYDTSMMTVVQPLDWDIQTEWIP